MNAEQFASQQKYRQQTEIDTVGVTASGEPQTKRGIQKRMIPKHEVSQTVVGCGHCTAPTDMNEKEAAGKLFSEYINAERVNRFWRGSMKRRVMSFLLSLIFIITSTVVVVPAEVEAATTVIKNFDYTGSVQTFAAPQTGTYTLEVWGAQGGTGYNSVGGKGGYSKGTVTLQQGDILYVQVGGKGTDSGTSYSRAIKNGGYNGGGNGAVSQYQEYDSSISGYISYYTFIGAGGGGTDIRIGQNSLYSRVIVAGGGSGGGYKSSSCTSEGYAAGGITSLGYDTNYQASQTKAGTNGSFGRGASVSDSASYKNIGPGGGGGWYGGGGAKTSSTDSNVVKYSGGGSGYVYTSSTASSYPSGCLLNSSYYMTDASTVGGDSSFASTSGGTETGHSGNGYARITYSKVENVVSGDTTKTFSYTGTSQIYVVPETGMYTIEAWGAQGGNGYNAVGGNGGYSRGTVKLTKGEMLYIRVGGKGTDSGTSYSRAIKNGGYNGGGNGAVSQYQEYDSSISGYVSYYTFAGAGGGSSDVRIGKDNLYARIIVAGGGSGGIATGSNGGYSGYVGGGTRSDGYDSTYWATQTSAGTGGSFGQGANISNITSYKYVSGPGGGGWYGGGGAKTSSSDSSILNYMGGGSGYVYTSSTASSYPTGCLVNSSYYMTDAFTLSGYAEFLSPSGVTETGHSGNGSVKITYTKVKPDSQTEVHNFSSTQSYTIPQTGKYLLEVWGAQGGNGYNAVGGKGGYSRGEIELTKGDILYINIGGKGTDTGSTYTASTKAGGSNGGGNGAISSYQEYDSSAGGYVTYYTFAGAGGGGTDIRIGQDSLYARVIVAGGGSGGAAGGPSGGSSGYAGGGETGDAGDSSYQAKQTQAGTNGSFGQGGNQTSTNMRYVGPGGGGGWYGGGGGAKSSSSSVYNYSGGGSGYVYTSSTASSYPSDCLLNSTHYLKNAYTIIGSGVSFPSTSGNTEEGHEGNGYARVTLVIDDSTPPVVTIETNGSTAYVAKASTKVTVSDESGIDESSLKYQWTQSSTAPAESTFATTFTNGQVITFTGQSGTWYLWILSADTLGNKGITGSKSFLLDCIAPSGTISIAGTLEKNGYKYSNNRTLTINLTATDNISTTDKMKVALINENDFSMSNPNSGISWLDFATTKTWTASSGDGLKKVYAIFKDEAGNQSVYLAQ